LKIGLIAGAGELPIVFAKTAQEKGDEVFILGIHGITDDKISKYGNVKWVNFGKLQEVLDYLKENNIKNLVMLGKIEHKLLLESISELDTRTLMFLAKLPDQRAETILGGLIKELEEEGFIFIDPTPYLGSLLVTEGLINNIKPTEKQIEDAKFGLKIAKAVADLDIGQTVVVKDKIVVAVEALEGTDKCILRAGELAGEGTVVCKVARKHQDFRFDVPVIGLKTLESMKQAKAKFLAVEAGKTYLLNREEFIKKADEYGISVMGFNLLNTA
jgi:hypothetical protein